MPTPVLAAIGSSIRGLPSRSNAGSPVASESALSIAGEPLKNPRNIVPDGKGGYWLTDPGIPAIVKITGGKAEVWLPI